MSVSAEYKEWLLEQLGRVSRVSSRRMFGGLGLYAGELFFAIVDDDRLYFKVDEATRPEFLAAGMEPFDPFKDGRPMTGYFEVPADVLEDEDALRVWVRKAVAVAAAAAAAKTKPAARKAPKGRKGRAASPRPSRK
jgi:DNA transformation protein